MTDDMESQIKLIAGKEAFRVGRRMFKAGDILSELPDAGGLQVFIIREKDGDVQRLHADPGDLLRHHSARHPLTHLEVAALLHHYADRAAMEAISAAHPHRRKESAPAAPIAAPEHPKPPPPGRSEATLRLDWPDGPPHAPSNWEKCQVGALISFEGKEYVGNQSRLRLIRFEDSGVGRLRPQSFTPQARQIIRFLSQHAESNGSGFSLKAELLAEFMHCLIGYPEVFHGGRRLVVHRTSAEIVPLPSVGADGRPSHAPGLRIDGGVAPLRIFKFILGRAGIWVGVEDEYWWVPGTIDVVWMRGILISKEKAVEAETENEADLPVINHEPAEAKVNANMRKEKCDVRHSAEFASDGSVVVEPRFYYKGRELGHTQGDTAREGGSIILRDKAAEGAAVDFLLKAGFHHCERAGGYRSVDDEAAGAFIDLGIPALAASKQPIYYHQNAVWAAAGVPMAMPRIDGVSQSGDFLELRMFFEAGGAEVRWHDIVKSVRSGRIYVKATGRRLAAIGDALREMAEKFHGILSGTDGVMLVPKAAAPSLAESFRVIGLDIPLGMGSTVALESEKAAAPGTLSDGRWAALLRGYQINGVNWMMRMLTLGYNVVLADEMGLGKTVQALALVETYRAAHPDCGPCFVLCPTSLVSNWCVEAARFAPGLKTLALHGPKRGDDISKIKESQMLVSSYALVKRDIHLYEGMRFGLLILDEAQHIKNPGTANSKICNSIEAEHRLVLTGTPLENSPEDIWSILDFLNPGMLGTQAFFKQRYGKLSGDDSRMAELAKRVTPFILRRRKRDVDVQLPPKSEQLLYCDMEPPQRALYESLREAGRSQCDGLAQGRLTKFDILTTLLRLRQLCCHPRLLPLELRPTEADSAKTDLLKELVLQAVDSGHRTLVFSQFTSMLAIIREWLDATSIQYEYLDGATQERQAKVDHFNSDTSVNLFLLSLKAGGVGLNLTGADTVIIYDPWWNPAVEAQATDRTHRIGQSKPVTSIKLVLRDSIEEKILKLQDRKRGLFNGLVENAALLRNLSVDDIQFLLD